MYIHADQGTSLVACPSCTSQIGSPQPNFDMRFVYQPCTSGSLGWLASDAGNEIQDGSSGYTSVYGNIVGWETPCGQHYYTMLLTCGDAPGTTDGQLLWYGQTGFQDTPVGTYAKALDCSGTGPDTITVSPGP